MWSRENDIKYVFVCGLHRSGTTILARSIGKLKNCTAFENTGVVMDEGQFLQDVYPPDGVYGGVGRFGFAPQAHLTERSPLLTHRNVARLRQSWQAYWDKNQTIRIEKTPANLLMTRFLQAAFENAYFIVVKRHPVPVSLATQKWSRTPLHSLFEHWLRCYETFDEDKESLSHLYELTYEDYINNSKRHLEEIAAFIGTESSHTIKEETADVYNKKYFDRWAQMLRNSRCKIYYRQVARMYESRFAAHGYSVMEPQGKTASVMGEDNPFRRAIGAPLCLAAGMCCSLWRADRLLRNTLGQFFAHHPSPSSSWKGSHGGQLGHAPGQTKPRGATEPR